MEEKGRQRVKQEESPTERIAAAITERFNVGFSVSAGLPHEAALAAMNERSVCRKYRNTPLGEPLVQLLCATALSAPSKSDLQQADIVRIVAPDIRSAIHRLLPNSPWIESAPELFVICGNGRRLRRMFSARGADFPNDHLDGFFNAAVDAAIVLSTFVQAAHLAGLGSCPISELRDHAAAITEMLTLPDHVFPVAGLTVGYPETFEALTPRLPLQATVHLDRYRAEGVDADIAEYDRRRILRRPYSRQRQPERFGIAPEYGWSEEKFRQYSDPQRTGFGAYIRGRGFSLD